MFCFSLDFFAVQYRCTMKVLSKAFVVGDFSLVEAGQSVKLQERSRYTEKEFRRKEARYESQLIDLREEKDQLQVQSYIEQPDIAIDGEKFGFQKKSLCVFISQENHLTKPFFTLFPNKLTA